jgi:tetratricopeptide (TPR) repeat protein
MSIAKKKYLSIFTLVINLIFLSPAFAVSIHVMEGGVPFASPDALIEEGIRLGSAELLREAWSHYEDSLKMDEEAKDGYLELGKIYFHLSLMGISTEKEFETARLYAGKAVEQNPDSPQAHRALGLTFAGRGAFIEAFEELTIAFHLNPGNEYVYCDLAALHLALQQPKKTIELLEGRNLKNGWSYLVLAMAWLHQDKKGKAVLNLMKAKKLGYEGYWLDRALKRRSGELGLPLNSY